MKIKNLISKKLLELIIIFLVLPLLLAIPFLPLARVALGFIGLIYVIWVSKKLKFFSFKKVSVGIKMQHVYFLAAKFIIISIITYFIVSEFYPQELFKSLLDNPLKFLIICLIYIIGSVVPQEFIYRDFFFKRYYNFFPNDILFVLVNGILFSLAHLFFYNKLVLLMTLVGGWIFSFTYLQTRSLRFTILEHTLYGCWLYAVGLGSILGFPN